MPLSIFIRKRDVTLVDAIDPDYKRIFGLLLHSSIRKIMYEIQGIFWGSFQHFYIK